jgi:hypothetical protein
MRLITTITAAAALALAAGAAYAQSTGSGDMTQANGQPQAAQPATEAGQPAAASSSMSTAGLPPIDTAKAGDPNVITNGPIPDTPENRAKYGQPMSNAGRHTKPAGN